LLLNYRLNLFGFMAHPALNAEGRTIGNYGLMDMQAALKWVQRNIATFGAIRLLGGVGGRRRRRQCGVAGREGLFHRAIFRTAVTPFAPKSIAEEKARSSPRRRCTSGDIAKGLRSLPADKIEALAGTASETGPFVTNPLVDGTVIPEQEIDLIRSGQFNKMPIMMGTTHDEGNFTNGIIQYFKKDRATLTDADYSAYLQRTYGGNAGPGGSPPPYAKDTVDKVLAHYPVTKAGAQMAWDSAHSDAIACRGQYTADALEPQVPVYMYLFDDRTAQSYFPKMPGYQPLAYHTADIAYVFTGYHGGPEGVPFKLDVAQTKLSDRMVAAWANFARGNPNTLGDTPWPRWKKGGDASAYFLQKDGWKSVQTNAQFAAAHQCDFWQSILLYK
jgi:para-nitrobenzyl esterase